MLHMTPSYFCELHDDEERDTKNCPSQVNYRKKEGCFRVFPIRDFSALWPLAACLPCEKPAVNEAGWKFLFQLSTPFSTSATMMGRDSVWQVNSGLWSVDSPASFLFSSLPDFFFKKNQTRDVSSLGILVEDEWGEKQQVLQFFLPLELKGETWQLSCRLKEGEEWPAFHSSFCWILLFFYLFIWLLSYHYFCL